MKKQVNYNDAIMCNKKTLYKTDGFDVICTKPFVKKIRNGLSVCEKFPTFAVGRKIHVFFDIFNSKIVTFCMFWIKVMVVFQVLSAIYIFIEDI